MSDRGALFFVMIPVALMALLSGGLATPLVAADPAGPVVDVPSGLELYLHEVRVEEQPGGAVWLRYRYVAEGLRDAGFDAVALDFQALCDTQVLPDARAATAEQAVISLAGQALDFGVSDPDVTQYFEAFRLEDGACIWEGY
ncbi:DUF6497 family protein [Pseudooceanicola aestuarii]|uniref:DUF6497 family protein n=1 Tax=Pseudooceanicola aestuarii TaxID=2697319 RepID=UPI001EF79B6C|nr:DUF6497 family protein [Pseudooceanicola aestuarii]